MKISNKSRRHGQARVLTLAAIASLASSSFANVINLTSSKDNTLYEDPTGSVSNGAGDAMFVGKTAGNTPPLRRGLLQFDLAAVPSNAQLNSATLTLTSLKSHFIANNVELHDALKDWGEGTSNAGPTGGAGTAATTGDATWINTFYNTSNWTNPGGDFSPAVISSASMTFGPATFPSSANFVADLTGWIANPATNFGWVLVGNEASFDTATRIGTRENADPASRPLLSIDYSASTWKTAGGAWSSGANWDFGVPNGAGAEANFTSAPAGAVAVNVDGGGKTAGILNFGGAGNYTLAGSPITLSREPANSAIKVTAGSHQIAAALNLESSTDVSIASGSTLTVTGAITAGAGVSVNKSGGGTLVVSNLRAGGLSIVDGTVAIAPNGAAGGTSRVSAFTMAAGRFDLSNNKLIVNGGGIAAMTGLIGSGRNGGNWSGSGIVTTQSAATTGGLTGIGIATAQQAKGLTNPTDTALFSGQTVTGSDVLIMYTYGGDANLDGKINVDDYGKIDSSAPLGIAGWYNGDFNYDGKINVDDYGIIDFNIGIQGAPFSTGASASALTAVPEPASTLASLGAAALTLTRRCRIKSKASSAR